MKRIAATITLAMVCGVILCWIGAASAADPAKPQWGLKTYTYKQVGNSRSRRMFSAPTMLKSAPCWYGCTAAP